MDNHRRTRWLNLPLGYARSEVRPNLVRASFSHFVCSCRPVGGFFAAPFFSLSLDTGCTCTTAKALPLRPRVRVPALFFTIYIYPTTPTDKSLLTAELRVESEGAAKSHPLSE